jgi:glycosyltransferase involved in cell wall biosynthesis
VPHGGRFILAFSSQSPHKNVGRLVQAFQEARRRYALPHSLVLVGHAPEGVRAEAWSAAAVVVAGYVNDATLDDLLGWAEFLVFPSLYEGFGLPVVEAMSAGLPVACSSVAALPEIAGGAALLFDPTSVESIAGAIATLAADPDLRRALRERGTARARDFSWEATANATVRAYRQCLASRRREAKVS